MNNTESTDIIVLKQEPIISYEKMEAVGQEVQQRIAELNLENQLVTEDTVKAVKKTKADLNKEFKAFEEQRKFIKEAVAKPYKDFEDKYKEFIAVHYNNADNTLKEKISKFEAKLKKDKEEEIRSYFEELKEVKGIDFITFERLNIKVNLSDSEAKLRKEVDDFFIKLDYDLDLLKSYPFSDDLKSDILFEYKKTLNLPSSVRLVQEREKARAEEQKKLEAQKEAEAQQEQKETEQRAQEPKPDVLQAPQVETPKAPEAEPLFETSFRVRGTKSQLIALKQFITENNIEIL